MNKENQKKCEDLWKQFEPQLRTVCKVKLRSHPDNVDDVISEVFAALCEKVSKDGLPEKPKAWLYGTLNNKINLKYREIYKIEEKETSLSSKEYVLPYEVDFINKKIDDIYNDEIKCKLKELLSEDEYKIIYAIHFQKLKMKEVATIFNTTESAVKQKHYRICNKLRKIIKNSKKFM